MAATGLLTSPAAADHNPGSEYLCIAATNVTDTTATLNSQTSDLSITSVTFTLVESDIVQPQMPVTAPYSLDVTGLTPGTVYSFTVEFFTVVSEPGEHAQTNETCTFTTTGVPPAPGPYACLPATNVTDTTATLNAGTTDPTVNSATFTLIIELDILAPQMPVPTPYSLDLSGLTPGTTYQYTVRFDPGEHQQSNETCTFTTTGRTSGSPGSPPRLPATGGDLATGASAGMLLMIVGAAALLAGRRRRGSSSPI